MSERREDLVRNMSAPPRSTLTLRPRQPPPDPGGGPAPSAWGLAWFGRLDFDSLLSLLAEGKAKAPRVARAERGRLRLRGAVALARSLSGGAVEGLEGLTDAALEDELLDWAARQAPDPALPPMLLASPAEAGPGRTPERDPARLLRLLLHHTGRTCDLTGPPTVGAALRDGLVLDLWAAP